MPCSQNFVCGNTHADINGWPVYYTDCNQINLYAHRVLSNPKFLEVVISSLATNRITYCKVSSGDCGSKGFSLGAQTQAELSTASSLAKAASADTEPISQGILGITAQILGMFGQHHAQAVANEQSTLCRVADSWNSWIQATEYGIQSGMLPLQDALNQLNQVYQDLSNTAQSVAKNTTDAANYYKAALDALVVWNREVVFPSLVPVPIIVALPAPVAGLLTGVASALGLGTQPVNSSGQPVQSSGSKLLVYAIIALVLAKIFKVF